MCVTQELAWNRLVSGSLDPIRLFCQPCRLVAQWEGSMAVRATALRAYNTKAPNLDRF